MTTSNSNTQTTQQQSTSPGSLGLPTVQNILGQLNPLISSSGLNPAESGAINQLTQNAQAGNPYAPQIGANATSLLAGGGAQNQAGAVNANYQNYYNQTNPLASNTNYDPTQNPAIQAALQAIQTQVTNQTNGQFASAGRMGSGQNSEALGMGLAQGEAPVLLNQYNQNVAAQQGAAQNLYNAGNTTQGALAGMQTQANANEQQGAQAAAGALNANNYGANATLAAQQLGQQIPAQNLGLLAQMGIPIAQLSTNSTGSGTSSTQNTPSLLSSIGQAVGIGASLFGAGAGAGGVPGAVGPTSVGGAPVSGGTLAGSLGSLFQFSDARLKEDIARVGTLFDGTPVYRYRYKGHDAFTIGLMAQDVETKIPDAVIEINGFKAVNYKTATEKAVRCLDFGC